MVTKEKRKENITKKHNCNKGRTLVTTKQKESIGYIKRYSKAFGGNKTDVQLLEHLDITHNTLHKYKKIIKNSLENGKSQ